MKKVIVVGSGAGGATIARELVINGMDVTIIEKGSFTKTEKAYECYDNLDIGVELLRTTCLGGTALVTAGNAVRTCQEEFKKMGIDLSKEFLEAEDELKVNPLPESHRGLGTKKIMDAASSLGLSMESMPKFINPEKCIPCGMCALGCPRNAKWSTINYLEEAERHGAEIITENPVTNLIVKNGILKGLETSNKIYDADIVILSAGAIETPRLLIKSGIDAGNHLFVDTFVTLGGAIRDIEFNKEVSMNSLLKMNDFILSPHYSSILRDRLNPYGYSDKDILGIMVKIKDDRSGRVYEDKVYKDNTSRDAGLLAEGSAIAGAILSEAGVDASTLVSTPARGAHPGGTAAIGDVVDVNLETEIEGLYVADASVFPSAPGAPPVLTIIALAKRLAKYITSYK